MGRPTRETIALLVPEGERDAEQGQIDRDEVDDAGSVIAYEGAAELLAGPIPIAVVTSGSTDLATARLRGAGLEPPAVLVTADKIERGKPDPKPSSSAPAPRRPPGPLPGPGGRPERHRVRPRRTKPSSPSAPRTPGAELEGASEVVGTLAEAVELLGRGRR